MKNLKLKHLSFITVLFIFCFSFYGCEQQSKSSIDYSDSNMWVFSENNPKKQADLFIVAPTIYFGDKETFNMPIDDEESRKKIIGALNMQLGIYDEDLNVFSPYYRQASFSSIDSGNYEEAKVIAYEDISYAFEYYMDNINNGRPFLIVGFSQGADMCMNLLKKYPESLDKMIACYIYGRSITEEEIKEYPQIIPATGEDDTGVVICFNSEAEEVDDTFTVPKGEKSICINPLNWKTDETIADRSLNKGACFLDYEGQITKEIPEYSGAYIDISRGTLKMIDINASDFEAVLPFLKYGEYHLYEYEFFYRNLQENVKTRIRNYLS